MTDRALKNARERYNELASAIAIYSRQIAEWKAEQERIAKFIEAWHEFADMAVSANIDVSSPPPHDGAPPPQSEEDYGIVKRKRATGNPKKEDVAEAAREIIAERGEPVTRSDLFKALAERGITLQGADPEMVLSTMLWRMKDKVVRLKSGGYWLADKPNKDVGYFPDDKDDIFEVRDNTPPAGSVSDTDDSDDKDDDPRDPDLQRDLKWEDL